jgi:very-short-patch-repair endonuclease
MAVQHDQSVSDAQRASWLESQGWRVTRFWNNDILTNTEGVLMTILQALQDGQTLTRLASLGTLSRGAGEG